MISATGPSFLHYQKRDGTIDSICRACYLTVCTSVWEADLESAEKDHSCDPDLLAHWAEIAGRGAMRGSES